jgi:hypothetical protein
MASSKFCTNCGLEFLSQPKFCPECGTPSTKKSESQEVKEIWTDDSRHQESFFESKNWRYIQTGIAVLVLLFTANYFLSNGKVTGSQVEEQTTTVTPGVIATPKTGRWEKNCITVQVPNPNYGKDLLNFNQYIPQEECSQAYVQD